MRFHKKVDKLFCALLFDGVSIDFFMAGGISLILLCGKDLFLLQNRKFLAEGNFLF